MDANETIERKELNDLEEDTAPSIMITRNDEILGFQTTTSPMSHYGHPVWVIQDEDPEPGLALWSQGQSIIEIEILETRGGWLVCRQPDGLLCGIIWSDGEYYANLIDDSNGHPLIEMTDGAIVRGTIKFDEDNPDDLGAILM